jgi:hypothetical protein
MDTGFGLLSYSQISQITQIQSLRLALERPERSFASLRMTAGEGLRMTEREGLS